jgi:hypothetical protein
MRPARCLIYLYLLNIIKLYTLTGTGKGNAIMSATIITTQRQGMRQFRTD